METQQQGKYQRTITSETVESSEPNTGVNVSSALNVIGIVVFVISIVGGLIMSIKRGGNIDSMFVVYLATGFITMIFFLAFGSVIRLLVDIKLELRELNGKSNEVDVAAYAEEEAISEEIE